MCLLRNPRMVWNDYCGCLCRAWNPHPRNPRAMPETRARIHAIAHVQDELGGGSGNSWPMGHMIERPTKLRMLGNIALDVVQPLARGLKSLLEFRLGLH